MEGLANHPIPPDHGIIRMWPEADSPGPIVEAQSDPDRGDFRRTVLLQ
jgi:hypothetical protein